MQKNVKKTMQINAKIRLQHNLLVDGKCKKRVRILSLPFYT